MEGANQVDGIEYSISNEPEIGRKVLEAAIENAKEQAKYLATAFDAKLGKVIQIQSEHNRFRSTVSLVVSADQDPFGGGSYVPEDISITRNITVVFELTD